MPVPQQTELHHSPEARFQNGNRLYKTVILGQGGVGKSGESTLLIIQCVINVDASRAWGRWSALKDGVFIHALP